METVDKDALIGGCLRLNVRIDIGRLQSEVGALSAVCWNSSANRVATQRNVRSIFLRGYAPAEGPKPIEDREVLGALPYCREIISGGTFGPSPQRCLLARLAPREFIRPHTDKGDYFANTIRIHIPIFTNASTWMLCAGNCYSMAEGEAWALNNSALHAVWNGHPKLARTHMICDYFPTEELNKLLAMGVRNLGRIVPEVDDAIRMARHQDGTP